MRNSCACRSDSEQVIFERKSDWPVRVACMEEKRLLVLGGGRHQLTLIRRAEARGVRVVLSDNVKNSPGRRFATYPTLTDWSDIEDNIRVAREFDVAGVMTSGTDQAVVTMADVASAL